MEYMLSAVVGAVLFMLGASFGSGIQKKRDED